jgi:DNA-binding NarL/FixJ family response regulator
MINKPKINANIFIVDHDPVYIASLKESIEKPEKYIIQTYATGEKFVAYLTDQKFRKNEVYIVFLGYHFMGEGQPSLTMTGLEILDAIKVINSDIEVVMLFGNEESSLGSYAKKSGAYAFVPKTDTIFLRINNIIMRIISQKKLEQKRRNFLFAVKLFVAYFIIATLAIVIHHFFFLAR